jgi:hypothetical protein
MQTSNIKLSAKARRVLGLIEAPAPRVRHPREALPPDNNLWKRGQFTSKDLGPCPPARHGSGVAQALPSRGPFSKEKSNV